MIIKIACIGIVGALLSVILRQYKPEYSFGVAIACGIIIFSLIKDDLAAVINTLTVTIEELGIQTAYIKTLIKIIGIAYLTQFAASICEDAGEKAIALKIEIAGRLIIVMLSVPIMLALINLITEILP